MISRYANGGWMASNPVPAEYPAWNTFMLGGNRNGARVDAAASRRRNVAVHRFFALHDANLGKIRKLLESSSDAKIRDFWAAALDEDAIEARGVEPLAPVLAACDLAATDPTAAVAQLHIYGVGVIFGVGEGPDDEKSSWTLLQIGQGAPPRRGSKGGRGRVDGTPRIDLGRLAGDVDRLLT